jgi:carboxylesterase type B
VIVFGVIPPRYANMNSIVKTRHGKLRGRLCDGVAAFKGVAYAAPPFQTNRLRPRSLSKNRRHCWLFFEAVARERYDVSMENPFEIGDRLM